MGRSRLGARGFRVGFTRGDRRVVLMDVRCSYVSSFPVDLCWAMYWGVLGVLPYEVKG